MHFLHDVLYKFPQVLTRRICFKNRELPYTVFIFTRQFCYLSVCMLRVRVSKLVIFFFQEQIPFAVVGSREEAIINKVKTRARQYPWGTVEGTTYVPFL